MAQDSRSLKHGDKAIVNGQRVIAGSVIGYAAQYHEDSLPALERARKFGHDLYWLNLCATCMCGDPGYYDRDRAEWADAAILTIGDIITIDDSGPMTIGRAPNRNFSLRAV